MAALPRRIEQLIQDVANHPHRKELIHLMRQQCHQDTTKVKQQLLPWYRRTTLNEVPLSN